MAAMNITALSQSDGVSGLVCVANSATEGILIGGFIIATFFIMLMVLKKWDFEKGFLVSSWSAFLLSAIAAFASCPDGSTFLSPYYALAFLMMAALSALYMWSTGD